jgi:hypothetical protein
MIANEDSVAVDISEIYTPTIPQPALKLSVAADQKQLLRDQNYLLLRVKHCSLRLMLNRQKLTHFIKITPVRLLEKN